MTPTHSLIELRTTFDSTRWQVAAPGGHAGPTLLLTWTVQPEPVDAGIPSPIRTALAEALCAIGACWFAGDAGSGVPAAAIRLRRNLSWHEAPIFRADRATELLAAFESGAHDWSMAAQWIVVGARRRASNESIEPTDPILGLLRALLEDWTLPHDWPPDVLAIVQAGVDGDAAGCHCRTRDVEADFRRALQHRATDNGVAIQTAS